MLRPMLQKASHMFHAVKSSAPPCLATFLAAAMAMSAAGLTCSRAVAAEVLIDPMDYVNDAAAQAAWQPMGKTAPVSADHTPHALKMPCNFKDTQIDRASWDHPMKIDLSGATRIQFEIACDDPTPIASFSFYLRSGNGWYVGHFSAASPEFTPVIITKADMDIEGKPSGWAAIDTLRISAWRALDKDTTLRIRNLRAITGEGIVTIIRAESAVELIKNQWPAVWQYTASLCQRLEELGLDYKILSDLDLTQESLGGDDVVIVPYSPKMPANGVSALETFLARGGKMLVFYTLPAKLQQVVGLQIGRHVPGAKGRFSSIRAETPGSLPGMPAIVRQDSWNIKQCRVVEGRSQVVAQWYDRDGNPTGEAAVVASDNCILVTHVLLDGDIANKRQLLIAMLGSLAPDLWSVATQTRLNLALAAGGHKDAAEVRKLARKAPHQAARVAFAQALADQKLGMELLAKGQSVAAMDLSEKSHQNVIRGWCLLERPVPGEHRAFWCHSAFGVEGMDWDTAIKNLADNGFTAILPNMSWGGTAFYNSAVLPIDPRVKEEGDQIALCLAACRKYGLQCHVWKVNWLMNNRASNEFSDRMKEEGRIQMGPDGKPIENGQWLCPSHPANQKLEIDAMVEIVTKYDVDGVHFDYIRYPGPEGCFCDGCRERFEKSIGRKVGNWPSDVRRGALRDKWLDFRRGNITAVVAAVSQQARQVKPNVKLSAAVFANWPSDRDKIGQDWKLWCDRGYLDFICPMDYTPDSTTFRHFVQRQVQWAGEVSCYPGIGLSTWTTQDPIMTLFQMIQITRDAGTGGFTLFNYGPTEAKEIAPLCALGVTRKD